MSLGHVPHYGRTDANHEAAKRDFRTLGCSVHDTSKVGGGFPDLLVGCVGLDQLVEVKTDDGDLEPSQVIFNAGWRGRPPQIYRCTDDAINIVAEMRKQARAKS